MTTHKDKTRKINLLPKEDFDRTTLGRILKWALTTFRFIVIIVEFVVITGFLSRFYLDVRIGDLDEEIKQRAALISSRADFEKEFRATQLKLSILSSNISPASKNVEILDFVSNNIPLDSRLISISQEGNLVSIRAASLSDLSINLFINDIKLSKLFTDVSLTRLEKNSDSPFNIFTIEANILM